MELTEIFAIVRKRISLILIITILSTVTVGVVSFFILKPQYKADISVIIGKPVTEGSQKTDTYNDLMMYQQMVKTYSILVKSRAVSQDVIDQLGLKIKVEELQTMVSATPQQNTEFLTITVKSGSAEEAVKIANQLAKSLKQVSYKVKNQDNVQLLDDAQFPDSPDKPKPILNMAIAFFLGLMASVGIAFLLEYMDNTIKSQEDIEKLLNIPVIGIIPEFKDEE